MFVVDVSMGHDLTEETLREVIDNAPFFIDPDNTDVMYAVACIKTSEAKKYMLLIFADDEILAQGPRTLAEIVSYVNSQGLLMVNARLSLD